MNKKIACSIIGLIILVGLIALLWDNNENSRSVYMVETPRGNFPIGFLIGNEQVFINRLDRWDIEYCRWKSKPSKYEVISTDKYTQDLTWAYEHLEVTICTGSTSTTIP